MCPWEVARLVTLLLWDGLAVAGARVVTLICTKAGETEFSPTILKHLTPL